jgi:hypothetical protein
MLHVVVEIGEGSRITGVEPLRRPSSASTRRRRRCETRDCRSICFTFAGTPRARAATSWPRRPAPRLLKQTPLPAAAIQRSAMCDACASGRPYPRRRDVSRARACLSVCLSAGAPAASVRPPWTRRVRNLDLTDSLPHATQPSGSGSISVSVARESFIPESCHLSPETINLHVLPLRCHLSPETHPQQVHDDQIEPNICPIQLDQCSTTWKYNQMFQVLINHICKCWLETPSPLNLSRGRGFMLTQIRKLSSFSPDTDGSASNSCRQKKERTRRIPRYLVRTNPHIQISVSSQHHIWYSMRQKKSFLNLRVYL